MPAADQDDAAPGAKHLPAIAAGGLVAIVAIVGVFGLGGGDSSDGSAVTLSESTASSSVPTDTAPTVSVAPTATPLAAPLVMGSTGDDVTRVQERLTAIGFQPGPVDGNFGGGTQQAVWAFKKLSGNVGWKEFSERPDQTTVDEATWQAMSDPAFAVTPRRPNTGRHVEIYLPLQVLALFDADNTPIFVTHIATGELNPDGTDATFCEPVTYTTNIYGEPLDEPETKDICAEAKTPPGVFRLERYEDGHHEGALGGMLNPWYFNYGIAIHGATNVPDHPASHGCVRMSNALSEMFKDLVHKGDAVYVWGYDGREPEGYTKAEMTPSFNRPDPSKTTTTSTSTTTTSTVAPTTTGAPTTAAPTTQAPATTSTATTAPTTTTTTVAEVATTISPP